MSSNDSKGYVTTIIKFLDKELEITIKDRKDPLFLMFLSQLELIELKYGEGILWYRHLKNNYGISFGNKKTESQLERILLENTKRDRKNESEKR